MFKRIMFVTDGANDQSLVHSIREHGFKVSIETRPDVAHQQALASPPDLLVLNIVNVDRAIEVLKRVRTSVTLNKTSVLVLADWGTGQATLALSNGADAFEPMPIRATRLLDAVARLMHPRLVMTATAKD